MKQRSADDEEWNKAAKKWLRCKKDMKAANDTILELAAEQSCYGAGVKYVRALERGRVRYKDVPQLKGVDLEPYRGAGFFTNTVSAI